MVSFYWKLKEKSRCTSKGRIMETYSVSMTYGKGEWLLMCSINLFIFKCISLSAFM